MRLATALLFVCAVAGCRAAPSAPVVDMDVDMAAGGDLATGGGDEDMATADLACAVGPEVCGNGCDDDRNGYIDDDDPACTSQMLVTFGMQKPSPALWRLILEPTPHVAVLDGNPVGIGGMSTLNVAFAPAAFLALDASTRKLEKRLLAGGPATTFNPPGSWGGTRDVCIFNGELIVVDPRPPATTYLHRIMSDGKTEILPAMTISGLGSACSSDGNQLYVARHTSTGPSEIVVFDKSASGPVDTMTVIPIPAAMLDAGYDRLVDFAYVKKSGVFIGLFNVGGSADDQTDSAVMTPFGLDGGTGPVIDGGIWHGVGEFLP
ncbi:MAG: hypothetical protein JWN44_3700 [Myxococcales bacterium]|nr:hypothetical protein [Myxococcales bacterium]